LFYRLYHISIFLLNVGVGIATLEIIPDFPLDFIPNLKYQLRRTLSVARNYPRHLKTEQSQKQGKCNQETSYSLP